MIRKFYPYNPKYAIKIVIHLIVAVSVLDVLYCGCIVPFWQSGGRKEGKVVVVEAWSELYGVRVATVMLTVLEMLVKGILGWMLVRDFNMYPVSGEDSLLTFDYVNKTDFTKPIRPIVNLNPNSNIYYGEQYIHN